MIPARKWIRRLRAVVPCALLLVSGTAAGAAQDWRWVSDDEGYQLTLQHCFGCHGVVFTGGRAPGLLTDTWNHMSSLEDMPRIIRDGIPTAGMPAFGAELSEEQIRSMARFIGLLVREGEHLAERAREQLEDPLRETEQHDFRVEPVVDGLRIPWSFAFLPDGGMLVAERVGALRFVRDGVLSAPIAGTPPVWARQDGGLLALALDPDFADNGWIYLSFAAPGERFATSMTRLVRGRVRGATWVDQETVWSAPQAWFSESHMHYGTRLLFADGYLWFSVGDRGDRDAPQDLGSPLGKIHRIRPNGEIPDDNPFVGDPQRFPSIWTYGHRNPQGLAMSSRGGLWASEHGPSGGDELNRIRGGHNYGWPLATGGREHDGRLISEVRSLPGMDDPVVYWGPEMAPSAIAFYEAERFPRWRNHLLVGFLASQELRRVELEGDRVIHQEVLFKGLGRVRDIQVGPDGLVYVALERHGNHGGIIRLAPVR